MQNNHITKLPDDLQLLIWEKVHNNNMREIRTELEPCLQKLQQKWYWTKIDKALVKWSCGVYSDIDILDELKLDTLVDLWKLLNPSTWESPSSDHEIKYYLLDYPITAISLNNK